MESSVAVVLVVDDDLGNLESVSKILEREGHRVLRANSGSVALEVIRKGDVQVVLTDLMMPHVTGAELLKAARLIRPDVEVVMMTAFGTVETAVGAMKDGAYDFIEKPLKRVQLIRTISKAIEKQKLTAENVSLKAELSALKKNALIGSSPAWTKTIDVADQAAPSSATVLLLGESGTGKELLARHIHQRSGRAGAFVGVNLAAVPETILEGELFGYERGAFTGAVQKRDGRIAQADHGSLFLDEIGELSQSAQVKLLRVLQEGEYEPLGGRTRRADFRLIAATHRNLSKLVEAGTFREDLFYRLNVISVELPPLRERPSDIPLLADHFVGVYARRNGRASMTLSKGSTELLQSYAWPGNVRELENTIERAVVLCRSSIIEPSDLPPGLVGSGDQRERVYFSVGTTLAEIERTAINLTLEKTHGDKHLAAKLLGISARTIYRKLADDDDGKDISGDPA